MDEYIEKIATQDSWNELKEKELIRANTRCLSIYMTGIPTFMRECFLTFST
jgi:hypothetical protein